MKPTALRVTAGLLASLAALLVFMRHQLSAAVVQFVWDYDFAVDPACSATVAADCVKEFRIQQGTTVVLTVPAPAGATTLINGMTGEVPLSKPYGNRTFTAVAVTEANLESDPSNAIQVLIKPGAPKNLRP